MHKASRLPGYAGALSPRQQYRNAQAWGEPRLPVRWRIGSSNIPRPKPWPTPRAWRGSSYFSQENTSDSLSEAQRLAIPRLSRFDARIRRRVSLAPKPRDCTSAGVESTSEMFSVFGGLSTRPTWRAARLQFCNSLVTNAAETALLPERSSPGSEFPTLVQVSNFIEPLVP